MPDDFINILKDKLNNEKGGVAAQNRMFPSTRIDQKDIVHSTPTKNGAVLLVLYLKNDEYYLAYIKRPEYDGPHSGQVAFPGGKIEDYDLSNEQAALRETFEEIGIQPSTIEILGELTPIDIYISNFKVFPFVGFLNTEPVFELNKYEVAYIIEVPLTNILDDKNKTTFSFKRRGKTYTVPAYSFNGEIVWGATAMITSELEELLKMKI